MDQSDSVGREIVAEDVKTAFDKSRAEVADQFRRAIQMITGTQGEGTPIPAKRQASLWKKLRRKITAEPWSAAPPEEKLDPRQPTVVHRADWLKGGTDMNKVHGPLVIYQGVREDLLELRMIKGLRQAPSHQAVVGGGNR